MVIKSCVCMLQITKARAVASDKRYKLMAIGILPEALVSLKRIVRVKCVSKHQQGLPQVLRAANGLQCMAWQTIMLL